MKRWRSRARRSAAGAPSGSAFCGHSPLRNRNSLDDGLNPVGRGFDTDGSVARIDQADEPRVAIWRSAAIESLDQPAELAISVCAGKGSGTPLERPPARAPRARVRAASRALPNSIAAPSREDERVLDRQPESEGLAQPFKHGRAENVSHAAHRLDAFVVGIDLRAQTRHHDVDDVGLRIETVIPDVLEDHRLAHRAAGMAQEESEQGKLARLQVDRLAGTGDFARDEVERDVAGDELGRFGRRGGAADERLHAREQFGERERFCEIIVAARSASPRTRSSTELFALRKSTGVGRRAARSV